MKFKANFEDFKNAVSAAGKVAKRNSMEDALLKIEAKESSVELSTNGQGLGAIISVKADVSEKGVFIAKVSSINMLTIITCSGNISAKRQEGNPNEPLRITYRNGMANMTLPAVSLTFNDVSTVQETGIALPLETLAKMSKDVSFAIGDEQTTSYHMLKLDVEEDEEDEILKIVMTSFNGRAMARRTAFAVKETYAGKYECLLQPEYFNTALDIFAEDENVYLYVDESRAYLKGKNATVCLRLLLETKFPEVAGLVKSSRQTNFSITTDKSELQGALKCVQYVTQEHKLEKFSSSVEFSVAGDCATLKNVALSQYTEKLHVNVMGDLPKTLYFDTMLLKNAIDTYPSSKIVISGNKEGLDNDKSPIWLLCGDNAEYMYCIAPRAKTNQQKS